MPNYQKFKDCVIDVENYCECWIDKDVGYFYNDYYLIFRSSNLNLEDFDIYIGTSEKEANILLDKFMDEKEKEWENDSRFASFENYSDD